MQEVQVSSACEPEVSSDVGEDINFEYDNESEFSCGDDNNRCELVDEDGMEKKDAELEVVHVSDCEPEILCNVAEDNGKECDFSFGVDDNIGVNSLMVQKEGSLKLFQVTKKVNCFQSQGDKSSFLAQMYQAVSIQLHYFLL